MPALFLLGVSLLVRPLRSAEQQSLLVDRQSLQRLGGRLPDPPPCLPPTEAWLVCLAVSAAVAGLNLAPGPQIEAETGTVFTSFSTLSFYCLNKIKNKKLLVMSCVIFRNHLGH